MLLSQKIGIVGSSKCIKYPRVSPQNLGLRGKEPSCGAGGSSAAEPLLLMLGRAGCSRASFGSCQNNHFL